MLLTNVLQMIIFSQLRKTSHMHHCAIDDQLHGKGLKKTHPRHRILELFLQPRLWSIQELQKALHDVSTASIYRNVRVLLDEGVITANETQSERYERVTTEHHDHLACASCKAIRCLPCPIPQIASHNLQLKGVCASCTK